MLNKKVLLLLTQSLNEIRTNLNSIVEQSMRYTSESLYVYINPIASQIRSVNRETANGNKVMPTLIEDRCLLRTIVNKFYENSFRIKPNVNVSCLLHNIISTSNTTLYFKSMRSQIVHCDLILTDSNDQNCFDVRQFCLANILSATSNANIGLIRLHEAKHADKNDDNATKPHSRVNASDTTDLIHTNSLFRNGIVAGTFDRLHIGHKILLSESTLLVQNKLLVGITYEQMIRKKLLYELIEPLDVRIGNVVGFLGLIAPHLTVDCVPINDPFGPSITEGDYQCLIVSKETAKGGDAVNVKRKENNLSPLHVHIIDLVEDMHVVTGDNDELKVSSSNRRKGLLGTLLRQPYLPFSHDKPYVIGLTGGLASGKSSVRKRLEKFGAATIDCDQLGHRTYEPNSNAYGKIVDIFGENILDADKRIDRRKLGSIVFANKDELKKLTDVVWPEIKNLIQIEIGKLFEAGKMFIIIEAALLIEAEWYKLVNEIWVCVVPTDEAIARTIRRDNINESKAMNIIKSQIDNEKRVSYANVVLSTLWEPEYTQKQVEKAWSLLESRTIKSNSH